MTLENFDRLLSAAARFQGQTMQAREQCRERYQQEESNEESILRVLIDGQIALLTEKITTRIETTTPALSYQVGLSTSFIRTHFIIADLILHSDLVEAMVLIRKQLESLARLRELDSKPFEKLLGKTPNIQNILHGEAKRMYGILSEVAHFARPGVTELLNVIQEESDGRMGPNLLPLYSEKARACFDLNAYMAVNFLMWLTEKLPAWYPDVEVTEEKNLLGGTIHLAFSAGVLRRPEDNK